LLSHSFSPCLTLYITHTKRHTHTHLRYSFEQFLLFFLGVLPGTTKLLLKSSESVVNLSSFLNLPEISKSKMKSNRETEKSFEIPLPEHPFPNLYLKGTILHFNLTFRISSLQKN
jgi:hypothetical protein